MIVIHKSKYTQTYRDGPVKIDYNSAVTNAAIRKAIRYNFLLTVDKEDHYYFNNKVLLSPSRLINLFSQYKFMNVPKEALKIAQNRGKRLMENLEYWFENQCEINEIPFLQGEREKALPIFEWLINNDAKVVAVEKFIHNGVYCGFVDMIIKMNSVYYVVEIKTRSKNEIYTTDRLQTWIYGRMLKNAPRILLIIDSSNIVHHYFLINQYDKQYFTNLKVFFKAFEIELPEIKPIEIC